MGRDDSPMSKQVHSNSASTGAKRATGRPTFHIGASVLQALREDVGLTQLELAKRVYARAGSQAKTSNNLMKTSASRWEASGTVQVNEPFSRVWRGVATWLFIDTLRLYKKM